MATTLAAGGSVDRQPARLAGGGDGDKVAMVTYSTYEDDVRWMAVATHIDQVA